MCYYVASKLKELEVQALETEFNTKWEEPEKPEQHFLLSGFAHPKLAVIDSERRFRNMRWGLIPSWVKDFEAAKKLRIQTLNAISETISEKPSFRGAVKAARTCIVPVTGFYEWHHHENGEKYPHHIYPKVFPVFLLAGLYETWENKAINEVHHTFTIITTAANSRMEWIHNSKKRMPAILSTETAHLWLDQGIAPADKQKLLLPYEPEFMCDHPISRLITSRKENPDQPAVMEPFSYPELN